MTEDGSSGIYLAYHLDEEKSYSGARGPELWGLFLTHIHTVLCRAGSHHH